MNPFNQRRRAFCQAMAAAGVLPAMAFAADNSPIQIMVNAGVIMDTTARIVGEQLTRYLDRPAVVMPKLGAGGRVAMSVLKNQSPDGRFLLVTASSALTIAPNIYKDLGYDPDKDFTPVSGLCVFDNAIAVGPNSPAKTLADLMKIAASRPDGLVYGAAPGTGSASHFVGISLAMKGGFKGTVVPYKGAEPAFADLQSGRLEALISSTGGMVPLHKSGQLRLLASSGSHRSPLAPDVPTLKESGVDVTIDNGTMLLGPANMPADVVARLHDAVVKAMKDPAVVNRLAGLGMTPWPLSSTELTDWIKNDRRQFAALVKASNYVPE